MDRRKFIKSSVAVAGAAATSSLYRPFVYAAAAIDQGPFLHGIASGDPLARGAIIWTRLTPSDDAMPGSGKGRPTDVKWEVAADPRFRDIVRKGELTTKPQSDHSAKVDITGLKPDTRYYYRFTARGKNSPVGRLLTAPDPSSSPTNIRFGLASCSNYEAGFFSGYRHMAERNDLDFVMHLGDYIYEYGKGEYGQADALKRYHDPGHEILSLEDYRRRHAQYKADEDLAALHAAHPFILTWDDHEVADNAWKRGAVNHQTEEERNFSLRRADAYKAYFEWMPIRLPAPKTNRTRIYRSLNYGRLADVFMLDLRQYRDEQGDTGDGSADDPSRTLTGKAQFEWFKRGLSGSQAQWHIIGNELMFTPLEAPKTQPFNLDAWDGYRVERDGLVKHISDRSIDNVVFLTGDIHSSWAADVPADRETYPVGGSAAVEFVGTSITSDNLDEITSSEPRTTSIAAEEGLKSNNPHIKMIEFDSHGYSVVDVTEERCQVDWYYLSDRGDPKATQSFAQAWATQAGANSVAPVDQPIGT
ncbi:MAG TPA: alkaline phosphatase D family protein [Actinomycetota bacterium]|nr:alkaline phosphatase D family protein [Actinomycetota bacterium]